MRRPALVGLALLALACPKPAPGPGERPNERASTGDEPSTSSAGSAAPSEGEGADASEPSEAESPSDCEGVCGRLHDCLLAEPPPTLAPRHAAALELDCLQLCIERGPALADSRFAACDDSTCGALLPCMRASWPSQPDTAPEPLLEPSPSGTGCREGCKRLGECFDAASTLIDDCTQGCEDKLGPEDEAAFGECTRSSDCLLMLECMQKFPGA